MNARAGLSSLKHFIDWRFIASIAALVLVAVLAYQTWSSFQANEMKTDRIDALVADQREQDQAAELSRTKSAADREALLRQNARILRKTNELQERLLSLVEFLNRSGIELPDDLTDARLMMPSRSRAPVDPADPVESPPAVVQQPKPPPVVSTLSPTPEPETEPQPEPTPDPSVVDSLLCGIGVCL